MIEQDETRFNLQIVMLRQDDPKKCTAAKLAKFNLAKPIKKISSKTIVLDPFADRFLIYHDRTLARSITAIDCSWNLADKVFVNKFSGFSRKLPPLIAGNPINYSKLNKLTTVEAISAALYILGEKQRAIELLDKFKWGHTFLELNQNLLKDYSEIKSESDIPQIISEYRLPLK
jgi:pre-rRNA-processing protein TSR3